MATTLKELASKIGCDFKGSETYEVQGVCEPTAAKNHYVMFVESPEKGLPEKHQLFLISADKLSFFSPSSQLLISNNVRESFRLLLKYFNPHLPVKHLKYLSEVASSVTMGANVSVGLNVILEEGAVIGDEAVLMGNNFVGRGAKIGSGVILHPGVVVESYCEIGDRTIVHANSVIGSDGFGYSQQNGKNEKIPQIGIVVIGTDCEIGSNVSIDRATLGQTVIGHNVVIDNLVQIAHNVVVGDHAIIAGQAGIGGSTKVGKRAILAGQAGIADHAEIGEGAVITAQSGIMSKQEVLPGAVLGGSPAIPVREHYKISAYLRRLPELFKTVKNISPASKDNT